MKYKELRKQYPKFIYEKYFYRITGKNLEIFFNFRIELNDSINSPQAIFFRPEIIIKNVKKSDLKRIGDKLMNNLVFHLGLIEMLSYWKATCSSEIQIQAGSLNQEQIRFWKDLMINGMGQFFYENKIDFRRPNFIKIKATNNSGDRKNYQLSTLLDQNKVLVPVGGGKDSVVTLEILKSAPHRRIRQRGGETETNIRCFSLNPTKSALKIMKISGCQNPIIVERKIDESLLELNRKSFLNGHTPFSAYLSFLSVLLSTIFNYKYIAFSNERSSNEGNVKYLGRVINHQYSKSFNFEQKFRNYSKKYLAKGVEYFSFLRPLYEIQIVQLFSRYSEYFPAFLSCNTAYKTYSGRKKPTGKWCGKCPKCLFIFASLYPFIKEKELVKIFGKNLFKKKELLSIMLEVIGLRKFKPFECVGTKKESLVAFYLSWKKSRGRAPRRLPFLLEYFEEKILNSSPRRKPKVFLRGLPRRISSISEGFLRDWNNQHNLPKYFETILRNAADVSPRSTARQGLEE